MDPADVDLVTHGELEVEGRLLDASNATLYCSLKLDGRTANAVYKPIAGERPLWDFPDGTLAGREVATYEIATASGLGSVPPTVLREGPLGEGMVQLWIDSGPTELVDVVTPDDVPEGWHVVLHAHDRSGAPVVLTHSDRHEVAELALLDVVVNNTDRKGGHVLLGADGLVYGVDHGICLHHEPKLRTVLWGWAGKPMPPASAHKLERLLADVDGELGETLATHLTDAEIDALRARVRDLLDTGAFPAPHDAIRAIPWPLF
ncbi:MAG: SCO1664 family protein [Actinophytocola sp.]|nr:SCO1664 family protein [Actinophytocola sp.]